MFYIFVLLLLRVIRLIIYDVSIEADVGVELLSVDVGAGWATSVLERGGGGEVSVGCCGAESALASTVLTMLVPCASPLAIDTGCWTCMITGVACFCVVCCACVACIIELYPGCCCCKDGDGTGDGCWCGTLSCLLITTWPAR